MSSESYYIPHDALIFTNIENINQFKAEKILSAYSTYIKNGTRLNNPWEIEIHLSGSCSFACKHCSYSTRHTDKKLGLEQIEEIFSLISKETHFVFFSGGGDPFTWRNWDKLLMLREKYIPDIPIGVSTNLFGLPENIDLNMIDLYQIHISGYDRGSYVEQIGFDVFDTFNKNLLKVCKANSKVTLKVLLDEYVYDHFSEFLDFFIQYDAENVIFKIPQNFLKNEKGTYIDYIGLYKIAITHPINEKYKIIINNTEDPLFNNGTIIDKCYIAESGLYSLIREDGNVFPCVASTNYSTNSMGNIYETNIVEIFRENFDKELYNQNMLCGKCPLKACRHYRFNKVIQEKYNKYEKYKDCNMPIML